MLYPLGWTLWHFYHKVHLDGQSIVCAPCRNDITPRKRHCCAANVRWHRMQRRNTSTWWALAGGEESPLERGWSPTTSGNWGALAETPDSCLFICLPPPCLRHTFFHSWLAIILGPNAIHSCIFIAEVCACMCVCVYHTSHSLLFHILHCVDNMG